MLPTGPFLSFSPFLLTKSTVITKKWKESRYHVVVAFNTLFQIYNVLNFWKEAVQDSDPNGTGICLLIKSRAESAKVFHRLEVFLALLRLPSFTEIKSHLID